MNTDFMSYLNIRRIDDSATDAIACPFEPLGVLLLLADMSSRRRRAYPEGRMGTHSHLSNQGF